MRCDGNSSFVFFVRLASSRRNEMMARGALMLYFITYLTKFHLTICSVSVASHGAAIVVMLTGYSSLAFP
jgi:hypothetical protein